MQYKTKFLHLIHMEECNTDDTRLLEYKLYTHTKVHVFIIDLLGIFCSVRSKTKPRVTPVVFDIVAAQGFGGSWGW